MRARQYGVRLILAATLLILTAPPSSATLYYSYPQGTDWHYSGFINNQWVYWRAVSVYDDATGVNWDDSFEMWSQSQTGQVYDVDIWGPIRYEWQNQGYETGRLGQPLSNPFYSYWDGYGPVYQQNFYHGVIRWHSRLCRCYSWGGYAETVITG